MKMCLVEQDCVMSWELVRNREHSVLSPESCCPYMGHPDLAEPGSLPISASGPWGSLIGIKRGLTIKIWSCLFSPG